MPPTCRTVRTSLLGAGLLALAVGLIGCGGGSKAANSPSTTLPRAAPVAAKSSATSAHPTTVPAASSSVTSAPATKGGNLSGTWSGSYSGSYAGSFTLTWQQSGSALSGSIKISSFGDSPTDINGTVQGDAISFGTVGSQAIQYSGSVSGGTMSGTWKIPGGGQSLGSGSWNATKS